MSVEKETVCAWACELGFAQAEFCSIEAFSIQQETVLNQPQLSERKQLRFSPEEDASEAKSLLVILWPYAPRRTGCTDDLFVDSYYLASNAAYHAAELLGEKLRDAGHFAKANVPYPAKAAAIRAGLGRIGKNDLFFSDRFGTRVVIVLVLTDINIDPPLKERVPLKATCLSCDRCVKSCPSGALDKNGMTHPERCMRNFMMEGIVVPEHLRERMDMSLIGCDICQRVCPMQPVMEKDHRKRFALESFVTDDSQAFREAVEQLAGEVGRNIARPQRVRAQAALLAGNSGNKKYIPVLQRWEKLPFEAVREHAKWAIQHLEAENTGT